LFARTPSNVEPRKFPSLNHFFKLLTDYRSVEAIDGDVEPAALFSFDDKITSRKVLCVWLYFPL